MIKGKRKFEGLNPADPTFTISILPNQKISHFHLKHSISGKVEIQNLLRRISRRNLQVDPLRASGPSLKWRQTETFMDRERGCVCHPCQTSRFLYTFSWKGIMRRAELHCKISSNASSFNFTVIKWNVGVDHKQVHTYRRNEMLLIKHFINQRRTKFERVERTG